MNSILTNSSAVAALATLRAISSGLATTQSQVSSGYRIGKASDNAAYWSIATTMRSDDKALSAVQDAIGMGAAITDTAYTGMQSAIDIVSAVKAKLVAATEAGVDKLKINDELTQLKDQLRATATSSSFNGQNWLYYGKNDDPVKLGNPQVPGSFVRAADGSVSVQMVTFNRLHFPSWQPFSYTLVDDSSLTHGEFGVLTTDMYAYNLGLSKGYMLVKGSGSGSTYSGAPVLPQIEIALSATTTTKDVTDMVSVVDGMLRDMTSYGAALGSLSKRIALQDDFVSTLRDTVQSGIGRLVDADMEEESSRLSALQTQQQLGIQSLSIANSASQRILTLFQ